MQSRIHCTGGTRSRHRLYAAVAGVAVAVGVDLAVLAAPETLPPAKPAVEAPSTKAASNGPTTKGQPKAGALCKQADQLLRAGQFKEAAAAAAKALHEAGTDGGQDRVQAAYQLGYASFALKDYSTAVRSLSTLAPFDQGEIGLHAQYLLARTHHLADERPEAAAGYRAVVESWERLSKAGSKAAAPDYVARAQFYWGVVLCEFGAPDGGLARFQAALALAPQSPVAAEARLRAAEAAVQVKKYQEAADAIAPLKDDPRYGVEALRFLAKAQYGLGTTPVPKGRGEAAIMNAVADPAALAAGIRQAVATLQTADERARSTSSPAAERAKVLLELGDMLQLDRKFKEAAAAYESATTAAGAETATSTAETAGAKGLLETAMERQAAALQLAGDYTRADAVCEAFLAKYPKSALRAEVCERFAENALLAANAKRDTATESTKIYQDAVTRFKQVIDAFPQTTQANLAQMGLASVRYLNGEFAEAEKLLAKIPESDRVDDLVEVAFLLADCQLRALPESADDALTSARVAAQLEQITTQLEGFIASKPNDPAAVDALLRVGYASEKLSMMLADPIEKRRTMAKARRAYGVVLQEFSDHPLYPVAMLENARVLAQVNGAPAVMELSKFQAAPLNQSALVPQAMIQLGDAQRTRRHPEEAIRVLSEVRAKYEAELLKDPGRAQWVPTLRYSLALSLKEAGKYEQAREMFQGIVKEFADRPEAADAVWRMAQCQTEAALAEVEGNRKALAAAGKSAMRQELEGTLVESTRKLRSAAEAMGKSADELAAKGDDSDLPAKMNYDAAWCWKLVGDVEVEAARRAMQAEAVRKAGEATPTERPKRKVAAIRPPEIPQSAIPLQPGEKAAREKFKAVADAGGDSPIADEARLELAELYAQRDDADGAIAVLKEALAKATGAGAAADLSERLQLRLAMLYLTKGDAKGAGEAAGTVLSSQRNAYVSYARALATEAAYRQGDWVGAIAQAKAFLDNPRGNGRIPGVSDLALLRMGEAQGQMGKWTDAKATLETWLGRFGTGILGHEGKYAYGWVNEHLGDTAKAIAAYSEAAGRGGASAEGVAAKAKQQVERLRAAQTDGGKAPGTADVPTAALLPRIPNLLLVQSKRAGPTPTNPGVLPAAPIKTPAVNNLKGTPTLPLLSPVARGIAVEIAPLPAPLAFDRKPYVQEASAPDDRDVPGWILKESGK